MVNHIALVFGVVEAERAAQVFREVVRCIVVVTSLHMHGEGILVAGEKGTVFALEELLATMAVPVVPTQALHVSRAELTELTSEDAVWSIVSHC